MPIVGTILLLRRMSTGKTDRDAAGKTIVTESAIDQTDDNGFATLLPNALRLRCPICKQANIFPTWFSLADKCPSCGTQIVRAQGYMLGSIYFNYGITAVIELFVFVVCHFLLEVPLKPLLIILSIFGVTFPLIIFPFGRSLWLAFDQYFTPRHPTDT